MKVTFKRDRKSEWQATTANEHIAKIVALPRGIDICVFSQPLLALIKCWEAATSAICSTLAASFVDKITGK
jgi:hypothetical protein